MAEVLSLIEYLSSTMAQPFAWGRSDCCTFAAGWVYAATGLDPYVGFRALYSTERAARCLIGLRGGLVRIFDEELAGIGLARTPTPTSGDIGIVMAPEPTAAIHFADRWILRSARGLIGAPATAIAAWRIDA